VSDVSEWRKAVLLQFLPVIVSVIAGLAIMCLFLGLYRLLKPAGELEDRLTTTVKRELPIREKEAGGPLSRFLKKLNLDKKLAGQTANELVRADLALTVNEYVMIRFGAAAAAFLIGSLIGRNILLGMAAALVGMQIPVLLLHQRSKQRQNRFQNQLVDVISMLTSGLKAGVGLVQAMELVRKEMPAPAGSEFGRVVREVGLGIPLGTALERLMERMPGDDLKMLITVINIQSEVGGNLAGVLDNVVVTIRERVRIAQEIRTLTAMQRITSYILGGLPFLVCAIIMLINPTYMQPMFKIQWIWLPGMALIMVVAGFLIISKIVSIKV
jgi:tight adherence protein B